MSDIPFEVWEFILERLSLESLELCCQGINKALNEYLLEWRVRALCWVMAAKGVDEVVRRLRRHHPSGIATDLGRLDQVRRFVQRHRDARVESVWEWMQLASQEPDAGWLCKGVSSAMLKGEGKCVMRQILGKPQAFGMILDTIKSSTCVAWNRAGSLLAESGSSDGTVRLWTPCGQEKGTLRGHSGWVDSVAFSPDSKTLASASRDGTVKLWDLSGDAPVEKGTLRAHLEDNPECTCSHHGGPWENEYEANPECPVTGHSKYVLSVAFSPDSKTLASASDDATVKLWDLSGDAPVEKGTLRGHTKDNPECECKFYEWGFFQTSAPQCPVKGHSHSVLSVAFSPDSKTLASSSSDKTVKLWDLSGDAPVGKGTLKGHSFEVVCVTWNHDGSLLASGSKDGTVRLWTPDGQEKGTMRGHSWDNPECTCSHSRGASYKANPECPVKGHSDPVSCVAWNNDGSLLASAAWDKTIKLWDPRTMEEKGTLRGHSGSVYCVAWNHDGSLLASAGVYGDETVRAAVRLWDPKTQEDKGTPRGHSDWVNSVAFSPYSKTLASACRDKTVKLWDLSGETPVEKGTLRGHSKNNPECTCKHDAGRWRDEYEANPECPVKGNSHPVTCVAWNNDGSLLASSSRDETVKLWDPTTMEEKGTLKGHSDLVTCVAWNNDGSLLASSSWDYTVKLWDLRTMEEKGTLTGHSDWVRSVAFSTDSMTLASGSRDKTVKLWDLSGDAPVEKCTLRGHTEDNPECICDHSQYPSIQNAQCPVTGHSHEVNCVAWNHDGSLLASGSPDRTVRLWTPDGQEKGTLRGHVASWQGRDRETKELAAKVKQGRSAGSNRTDQFIGTDQFIVTADGDTVYVYKTNSVREDQGEPLACFRSPASVTTVSCMGIKVVVGCEDGQVSNCPLVARTLLYV